MEELREKAHLVMDEVRKGIEKFKSKAEAEARKTVADEIRSEFEIEAAINKRIDEKIEEKLSATLNNFFADTFTALTASNAATDGDKHNLTPEQQAFKELFEQFIASYVFNSKELHEAAMDQNAKDENIKSTMLEDIATFRREYLKFIAKHCSQRGERKKLADIFGIIEER